MRRFLSFLFLSRHFASGLGLSILCLSQGVLATSSPLKVLYSFPVNGEGAPQNIIRASDGNFYGTTDTGGTHGGGSIFQVTPSGVLTTLYSLGTGNDGINPYNQLVQGNDGSLYGTTYGGGAHGVGTVFKITTSGSFSHLYDFADGGRPLGALVQGSDANLYGTTQVGGANALGSIFKISTTGGGYQTIYSFTGPDGGFPTAGLVDGGDGFFYGTTQFRGGSGKKGTIFKVDPSGALTVLYRFSGSDGAFPASALVNGGSGNFYGTTQNGGNNGQGTLFRMSTTQGFASLYSFTGGADGGVPVAGLTLLGADGKFYGVTSTAGANGYGTLFRISSTGTFEPLYNFTHGNDGAYPSTTLASAPDAHVYGVDLSASTGQGTLFKFASASGFATVHIFAGGTTAAGPTAGLVQGSQDGKFYGTAANGGLTNSGIVFRVDDAGNLENLHSFNGGDGAGAYGGLVEGSDHIFYGTTAAGGTTNSGTVFKITSDKQFTKLHDFVPGQGEAPQDALVQGNNGDFYGTTFGNGINGVGTIFEISSAGTFNNVHFFNANSGGYFSGSGLTLGNDGNLYGVTYDGGDANSDGVVFQFVPGTSSYNVRHTFTGADGSHPQNGALTLASDGLLYGTTQAGGTGGYGTIFNVSTDGTVFNSLLSFAGPPQAWRPNGMVMQGSDHSFYGVTYRGGPADAGVIFRFNTTGGLTPLYNFNGPDGALSTARLIQTADGSFYGTTSAGGANGTGTVFKLSFAISFSSPAASSVTAGQAFNYTISASNADSYTVSGLPPGLSFDPALGLIEGTPTQSGDFDITITAHNAGGGTAMTVLHLHVDAAASSGPVITSGTSANGRTGEPFSFQILADNITGNPVYSAANLPQGLSIDQTTGLISGTVPTDGGYGVNITVSDSVGSASAPLQLTFAADPGLPVINSPTTATVQDSQSFNYTISAPATTDPGDTTTYGLNGSLPSGLNFDSNTGTISGTYQSGGAAKITHVMPWLKTAHNRNARQAHALSATSKTIGLRQAAAATSQTSPVVSTVEIFAHNSHGTTSSTLTFHQPIVYPTPQISVLGTGHSLIEGGAEGNATVTILASPDLLTAFSPIATVMSDASGAFQFEDPGTAGVQKRFYRASFSR